MANVFSSIGGARVRRSLQNLSYRHITTCDLGDLIPIMHKEVIPGDIFTVGVDLVVRLQPLAAPVFHDLDAYIHFYFVPHRILWKKWTDFITRGKDGTFESIPPGYDVNFNLSNQGNLYSKPFRAGRGSLWDYLGYPILSDSDFSALSSYDGGRGFPRCFRQRCYNLIWYEYYRDQNLTVKGDANDFNSQGDYFLINERTANINADSVPEVDVPFGSYIRTRCWEKDYFTSMLSARQRGPNVALPVRGDAKAFWAFDDIRNEFAGYPTEGSGQPPPTAKTYGVSIIGPPASRALVFDNSFGTPFTPNVGNANAGAANLQRVLNNNIVDTSSMATVDIAEFREAFQINLWMERNMRAGIRLKEFLIAHYGKSPRDERLQRPEYLGGMRQPVIVSEVLQTSSTDDISPQGHMSGHGVSVDSKRCFRYSVQEHGTIMGIFSAKPRTAYSQGIERTETMNTVFDYYFPEFAHLSEQAVRTHELYVGSDNINEIDERIGFQARYNEYRYSPSKISGEFRDVLDYWHFGRKFSSKPVLNNQFVTIEKNNTPFLVKDYHQLMVQAGFLIRAVRPMPITGEPGLIDHS